MKFEDPEEFITKVETKALEYQKKAGDKRDEEDTLEHVCYAVYNVYKAAVRPLKKRIDDPKDPLEELKEVLRVEYAELSCNNPLEKKTKDNDE